MSNAMELVNKDGQEEHLGIECPQYMFSQVIEIPHRTVLSNLVEDIGAKESPIFTSIPYESLRFKANEQVIEIPPKTVLLKVMEAIGAKTEPIFVCTPCESLHFKVCVELDMSGARISIGKPPPPPIAKVEGEICDSPELAETSAIMNAFKYLGQKHSIQVLDYSSSMIKMFRLGCNWGDVDDLDYLSKKLIEQWDLSLKKCEQLSQHLDYKLIMDDNYVGITEASQVYTTLDDFIIFIIKRYRIMPIYARAEMEKIQDECQKYNENTTKKLDKFLCEVHYMQSIWFSEKDVLDYVLSYLGTGKAKYSSVPSDGGKVEGKAKFLFPCIVDGRFHKLEVHMRSLASSRAQEVAARAALLFMESNLNVKIIDVNYVDRQIAEKEYRSLEFIKDRFLEVARQMKTQLSNMVECITGWCAVYSGDARLIFGGPMSQEQMMAVEFCSKSLEVVRADCATHYESSASISQEIEKLCCRLESL